MANESLQLPNDYGDLIDAINERVATTMLAARQAVNQQLVTLYWDIGCMIALKQQEAGWGNAVVERIAADLRAAWPDRTGFSRANVFRMRAFYLAYSQGLTNVAQPVRQIPNQVETTAEEPLSPIVAQPVGQIPPELAAIPWGHNVCLIEKVETTEARLWYARQTMQNGWSRAVLVHQIESDLLSRQGAAITNFQQTLPAPQSDLANELIKDPYHFGFLGLSEGISERQLEDSLLTRLTDFLLELGKGFAFAGRQYPLRVADQDYYLDLLFYHLDLRCFVVIDLKIEAFKPEFAGKMSFYLTAVDDQLAKDTDQPSIGLVLCKEHNHLIVEYTLRNMEKPLGVASYQLLPKSVQSRLPSPEQLESVLGDDESDGNAKDA